VRIFVYEYLTAGGRHLDGSSPPGGSMLREGAAMLNAVCRDLSRIAGAHLIGLRDSRLPDHSPPTIVRQAVDDDASHAEQFDRRVIESDYALLIAPEINGRLTELAERAERLGATLISPDAAFIRLTTNKLHTIQRLRDGGVPVPLTVGCHSPSDLASVPPGQWVCKPVDGAGSWLVRCGDREDLSERLREPGINRTSGLPPGEPRVTESRHSGGSPAGEQGGTGGPPPSACRGGRVMCVQAYCQGRPASVAALCGGSAPELLPPCWQWVEPPSFTYQGGELMTEPNLIVRAHRLARQALVALPATRGYVGLDLILGAAPDGCEDVMIEVNPRLTTSYVGLRERAIPNLGQAMWQGATGQPTRLSFLPGPLQFDTAGTIRSMMSRPGESQDETELVP
jgi:predicted ATP-grasp superfamily ATP-dependent carboligase